MPSRFGTGPERWDARGTEPPPPPNLLLIPTPLRALHTAWGGRGAGANGRRMFEFIARYMSPPLRLIMSNLWLLSPLVTRILSAKPNTNAAIRTTTAVTVVNAGFKARRAEACRGRRGRAPLTHTHTIRRVQTNALPSTAKATVNHRIHPADSVDAVRRRGCSKGEKETAVLTVPRRPRFWPTIGV